MLCLDQEIEYFNKHGHGRHGTFIFFKENGLIGMKATFNYGRYDGVNTFYHDDGDPSFINWFVNGSREGESLNILREKI